MSLIVLDAIFFLVDYLSLLFEPFILRLCSRLNFNLKPKQMARPRRSYSPRGLDQEIADHWKQRETALVDSEEQRESLLSQCRQLVTSKWSWLSYNTVALDPIVELLDWTSSDIYLIDDWDFPFVMPNFERFCKQQEGETNSAAKVVRIVSANPSTKRLLVEFCPLHRQPASSIAAAPSSASSIVTLQWCTVSEYLTFESRSSLIFQYTQLYPELVSLFAIISDLLEAARLIEPRSCLRSSFLLFSQPPGGTNSGNNIRQAANKLVLDRYALLLMTVAHLSSSEAVSKKLHSSVDELDDEALKGAFAACRQYPLAGNLFGFLCRYSQLAKLSGTRGSITIAEPVGDEKTKLEFNLNLPSDQLRQPEVGRATATATATTTAARTTMDSAPGQRQLVVLDPVAPLLVRERDDEDDDDETLIVKRPVAANSSPLVVNLTKDLAPEISERIGRLCGKLAAHLGAAFAARGTPLVGQKSGKSSLLLDLFALSESFTEEPAGGEVDSCGNGAEEGRCAPMPPGRDARSAPSDGQMQTIGDSDPTASVTLRYRGSGGNKLATVGTVAAATATESGVGVAGGGDSCDIDGQQRPSKRSGELNDHQNPDGESKTAPRRKSSTAAAAAAANGSLGFQQPSWFGQRKLLKNLLYLALFLLVRNLVVNYLEYIRANLREQARGDLLELKRQMMAPSDSWFESDFDGTSHWERLDLEQRERSGEVVVEYDEEGDEDELEDIGDFLSSGDPSEWPAEWGELLMRRLAQIQEQQEARQPAAAARAFAAAASASTFSTFATVEAKDQSGQPEAQRSSAKSTTTSTTTTTSPTTASTVAPTSGQSSERTARPDTSAETSGTSGGSTISTISATSPSSLSETTAGAQTVAKDDDEANKTGAAATSEGSDEQTSAASEKELRDLADSMKALRGLMGQMMAQSFGGAAARQRKQQANGAADGQSEADGPAGDAAAVPGAEFDQLLKLMGSDDGEERQQRKSQKSGGGGSQLERLADEESKDNDDDDDEQEVDMEEMLGKLLEMLGEGQLGGGGGGGGDGAAGLAGLNLHELLSGLGDIGAPISGDDGQAEPEESPSATPIDGADGHHASTEESPGKQTISSAPESKSKLVQDEVWDEAPEAHDEL